MLRTALRTVVRPALLPTPCRSLYCPLNRPVILRFPGQNRPDKTVVGISKGAHVLLDYMQWWFLTQGGKEEDAAVRRVFAGEPAVQALLSAEEQDASGFAMASDETGIIICVEKFVGGDQWEEAYSPLEAREKTEETLDRAAAYDVDELEDLHEELLEKTYVLSYACDALRAELAQQEKNREFYRDAAAQVSGRIIEEEEWDAEEAKKKKQHEEK